MAKTRKGLMIILDGYGEGEPGEFNAVENANTPFLKSLKEKYPSCLIGTDSKYVGLPINTMGGSEVGHMTIGGGKVKKSMQVKVDDEIESGEFYQEKVLVDAFKKLVDNGGNLHVAGLWSDKQVHSNINHCFALMKMAKEYNVKNVFIHAFTDGRDCAPRSCRTYFDMFEKIKNELKIGEIATIGGRFYAMDRENNMERTEQSISKMTEDGADYNSVDSAIEYFYENDISDEFFKPCRIKTSKPYALRENDLLIFFNTRGDRMKQPVAYCRDMLACDVISFCEFVEDIDFVFKEDNLKDGLCEYLSKNKKKQLKISESTKYAHVTYFFNGGREEPFETEERIHIETQKTNDYALTPFMKAKEITEACVDSLNKKKYDAIIVNYSNPDMVGHTGNYNATVSALECLDKCVEQVVQVAKENDYFVLICADHGNAETMRDEFGNPQTAHTLNPVRCVVIDEKNQDIVLRNGGLCDIAPTFLKLMEMPENPAFEGTPLY
ncbi:MAG: 2,3-bisphosphoglycerate-independent phosphoglycerate mutase [Clostridia bacterium]|nr:2,3-bisphosphoglycerate-independent phosphoglycerate mutase [Clostridia bacterium]